MRKKFTYIKLNTISKFFTANLFCDVYLVAKGLNDFFIHSPFRYQVDIKNFIFLPIFIEKRGRKFQ